MITSIMGVGAVFGAVNTMYAAVSSRTPEIAVLLTLGFPPRSVMASFLAESAVIALAGGVIGCLLALPINGVATSTTNWASIQTLR
jgi:putative ABC transport system permease protein